MLIFFHDYLVKCYKIWLWLNPERELIVNKWGSKSCKSLFAFRSSTILPPRTQIKS
jgi:hypothetical protein